MLRLSYVPSTDSSTLVVKDDGAEPVCVALPTVALGTLELCETTSWDSARSRRRQVENAIREDQLKLCTQEKAAKESLFVLVSSHAQMPWQVPWRNGTAGKALGYSGVPPGTN
jgi:hypothetical protein